MDAQVAVLSDAYRVILSRYAGSGDAPNPPGEHTLADFTGQVDEVLPILCGGAAGLGGFSMGGLITQAYGAAHHADLAGLMIPMRSTIARRKKRSWCGHSKMMAAEGTATVEGARARWFRDDEVAAKGGKIDLQLDGGGRFCRQCKAHWVFATSDVKWGKLGDISCPRLS